MFLIESAFSSHYQSIHNDLTVSYEQYINFFKEYDDYFHLLLLGASYPYILFDVRAVTIEIDISYWFVLEQSVYFSFNGRLTLKKISKNPRKFLSDKLYIAFIFHQKKSI